jgi:hypothetical protein
MGEEPKPVTQEVGEHEMFVQFADARAARGDGHGRIVRAACRLIQATNALLGEWSHPLQIVLKTESNKNKAIPFEQEEQPFEG